MRRFLLNLKSVRLVVAPLIVTALGLAVISSCAPALSTPAATPAAATRATPTALATATAQAKVEEIARDIVSNVGEVSSVRQGDPRRVIFVFTENHASRLGQIEIAVMLNRLYLHYGLRHIGLEGVMAADSPLDASWFRPLSPPQLASGAKQEVAVKLLSQGEISSAELMTLVYPEIVVHGIEKADEYPLGLSDAASGSPLFYLLAIAEKSMLPPQKAEAQKLCNEAEQAPDSEKPQKIQDCIDYVMGTNEWTKQQYAKFTDPQTLASIEELSSFLTGIETKAAEVKADVTSDDKAGLDELKKFYKARQAASDTMALNTLALAEKYPGAPVAITVGSAHAPRAADLLTAKGVSFAIIKPRSLDSDDEKDYLSDDALARKQKLVSVDEQGGLGRVLDNRWKPRPVLPKIWFRSEAQIKYLATVLARAVRRGERIPFEQTLRGEGSDLQYIKLDPNSFEMDGGDLIFRVDAQTDDSRKSPVPVYVRAKAIGDVSDKTLEQRLLEEREKTKQPPKLDADGLILTETSRDVIAKFAPDYATIKKKGLPSG